MSTPRERWEALLDGRETDRTVSDIAATKEMWAKLRDYTASATNAEAADKLGADLRHSAGPVRTGPPLPEGVSIWGVEYRSIEYSSGSYREVARSPLALAGSVADVERHAWPDPDDWDYSTIREQVLEDNEYRYVSAGAYQPMLEICDIRGLEQIMVDFAINPEIAHAIQRKIFEFSYERNRQIFEEAGDVIDMTFMSADLGTQLGPLISVDHYREFFLPYHREMAELAKKHDLKIMFHSDGAIAPFIRILIDQVGIDVLNPVQWTCAGMERDCLAREFGRDVVFHGAVDNQNTLPFGTPEDVRREVLETREIWSDCRWIVAPCHNAQPNTPPENVEAMIRALDE